MADTQFWKLVNFGNRFYLQHFVFQLLTCRVHTTSWVILKTIALILSLHGTGNNQTFTVLIMVSNSSWYNHLILSKWMGCPQAFSIWSNSLDFSCVGKNLYSTDFLDQFNLIVIFSSKICIRYFLLIIFCQYSFLLKCFFTQF